MNISEHGVGASGADGVIPVVGYNRNGRPPEEVSMMEKAARYGADAVFFEASRDGKPSVAQAFIYRSDDLDSNFGELHQKLWSWGGVPLVYRVSGGLVQLFRCAHRPDFESKGEIVCKPFKTLKLATQIAEDPWWDSDRLCNGTLWDDPAVCKKLLSSQRAAQKTLINAVNELHGELSERNILPSALRRRLLILAVLIAYLEARKVFEEGFFEKFLPGATKFFQVLADGEALLNLLEHLEERFNGHVFVLTDDERDRLSESNRLASFARLVEGRQEKNGQLTLWQRYSFADLPVELISHIYQLFVTDSSVAVYTPHFVVRLMVGEVLSWERMDRIESKDEVILDPACGSGIFLVEAFKRLVLHWRFRNEWRRPNQTVLKRLARKRLRGIDLEEGAVELAAFSLCLGICDSLEPEDIRSSVKLFPRLKERTIHTGCFFETREQGVIKESVGVIVGNPPFASKFVTSAGEKAYEQYQNQGRLPDKQVAYLFLHESMEMLARGGVLSMLQQYNFLYNQQSLDFRRDFIRRWDVREILDFISVRGLFQKGGADTKVVVVVAEARKAPRQREILHATFRRSGRTDAEQGFDIDYYDMHWLPRKLALSNDKVWRCDLLGGGRLLGFVDRLSGFPTLREYAAKKEWDFGEGFITGRRGVSRPAKHIIGKPFLPSTAISESGIDTSAIKIAPSEAIEGPRSESRFTPPMLLIREQMDLPRDLWTRDYLTYGHQIMGLCAPKSKTQELRQVATWIDQEQTAILAYIAATSHRLFCQKSTSIAAHDISSIPYSESGALDLTAHEKILVEDIVEHHRELVRLGESSEAMSEPGVCALPNFNDIFTSRIKGVYKRRQLRALEPYTWPGVVCQPYAFGRAKVDWSDAEQLSSKIELLLQEKRGSGLSITRIARLYDGGCIFLLKPNRLRYWLRSVALRDADETLSDLAEQGF